jgi:hypothetical protein
MNKTSARETSSTTIFNSVSFWNHTFVGRPSISSKVRVFKSEQYRAAELRDSMGLLQMCKFSTLGKASKNRKTLFVSTFNFLTAGQMILLGAKDGRL